MAQVAGTPEAHTVSGYILGSDAELDLNAIWEYIADDNVDAADRWIDARSVNHPSVYPNNTATPTAAN